LRSLDEPFISASCASPASWSSAMFDALVLAAASRLILSIRRDPVVSPNTYL